MTDKEALKVIRNMAYLSAHVVENGVEAYEHIEQLLSKHFLPSNLDEVVANAIKDKESAIRFLKSAGIMDENGELAEIYRSEEHKPAKRQ